MKRPRLHRLSEAVIHSIAELNMGRARFATQDPLNAEIWGCSRMIHQDAGFRPEDQALASPFGAQQAALGTVLPWIPDVTGAEWTHPEAVLVVGAAPPPFLGWVPVHEYQRAAEGRWQTFAALYRRLMLEANDSPQALLPELLAVFGANAARFALFDLCRASLVPLDRRGGRLGREGALCWQRYVERPESRDWNQRRLEGSRARMVLALGTMAEHGLLRLLAEAGYTIHDLASGVEFTAGGASATWAKRLARRGLTLEQRLASPTCWCVGSRGGEVRWYVAPVHSPQSAGGRRRDPGYARTVRYLEALKPLVRGIRLAGGASAGAA